MKNKTNLFNYFNTLPIDKNILNDLKEFGYNYYDKGPIGRVDGILIKNNKLEGGADKRGDDAAYGF